MWRLPEINLTFNVVILKDQRQGESTVCIAVHKDLSNSLRMHCCIHVYA